VDLDHGADMREAVRWCRVRGARAKWAQDESSCRVEVERPDGQGVLAGVGPGFLEAYVVCRMRFETFFDGPPTEPLPRPGGA
jgi:hypothetical protein